MNDTSSTPTMARWSGRVLSALVVLFLLFDGIIKLLAPLFTHVLFGAYLGLAAWGGLYLRSPGLRDALLCQRSHGHRSTACRPTVEMV